MSEDGKILNRGLDALLGSSSTNNQRTIKDIDPWIDKRREGFNQEQILMKINY
jgi:hypothetical protein